MRRISKPSLLWYFIAGTPIYRNMSHMKSKTIKKKSKKIRQKLDKDIEIDLEQDFIVIQETSNNINPNNSNHHERNSQKRRKLQLEDKHGISVSSTCQEDLQKHLDKRKATKKQPLSTVSDMKAKNMEKIMLIYNTLSNRFKVNSNPSKAAPMAKYMRNQFPYFGIQTPERRALYKDLWAEVKELNSSDIRELAKLTWQSTEREFQMFTLELLEKEKLNIYEISDGVISCDSAIKTIEFIKPFLVSDKSWWDSVDTLAVKVIGPLVKLCPEELLPVMDEWNKDNNFWLCRTSIIYQNSFKSSTDAKRLFRYCLSAAHSEEFFIQKAIGWALREYHKVNPVNVKSFVQENTKKLSALSIREAMKHEK